MVLMDLNDGPKTKSALFAVLFLSFLGVLGALCFSLHRIAAHGPLTARPLGVEEQEAIHFGLSQLGNGDVRWESAAADVETRISDGRIPLLLAQEPGANALIRPGARGLVVSPRFFESDSSAQREALLQALLLLHPELASARPEIANRPAAGLLIPPAQ